MSKQTAELIIRHLLGIVAALRKEYEIPEHNSVSVVVTDKDSIAGAVNYTTQKT